PEKDVKNVHPDSLLETQNTLRKRDLKFEKANNYQTILTELLSTTSTNVNILFLLYNPSFDLQSKIKAIWKNLSRARRLKNRIGDMITLSIWVNYWKQRLLLQKEQCVQVCYLDTLS
ncbi:2921_t:CDS:2, partial [Dentiscutata heterogama]